MQEFKEGQLIIYRNGDKYEIGKIKRVVKDGAFVVEVLRRKFDNCRTRSDFTTALGSVYGLEIQADNIAECIRRVTALCQQYFKPTRAELQIINDHYIMCDSLKVMRMMADENLQSR